MNVNDPFLVLQDVANIEKEFPELSKDVRIPPFFGKDQFFSSVLRVGSPDLQLWTHYDVSYRL